MPSTNFISSPLSRLTVDGNGNGRLALNEIGALAREIFLLPGDLFIWILSTRAEPLAEFLGIGPNDYGGFMSGLLSACTWVVAIIGLSVAFRAVRDLDRRLTGATRDFVATVTLRARITRALARQTWRAWFRVREPAGRVELASNVELSGPQVEALRVYAGLAAGYALSVSDVARAIGGRSMATHNLLDGLQRLGFLNRTLGGPDGETAYTLTNAGKALLSFQNFANRTLGAPRAE